MKARPSAALSSRLCPCRINPSEIITTVNAAAMASVTALRQIENWLPRFRGLTRRESVSVFTLSRRIVPPNASRPRFSLGMKSTPLCSGVELPWPANLLLGVFDHFLPLRHPSRPCGPARTAP